MIIKETPTVESIYESVFKTFVSFDDDKIFLTELVPKEVALFLLYIMPENTKIIYGMSDPVCECGCKMHKHQHVDWKMDKKYPIYKYQYKCPKCSKTKLTPLDGIVDKHCNYTRDIRDLVVEINSKEHMPYSKTAELVNEKFGTNISRQTVFINEKKKSEDPIAQKEKIIEEKKKEKNIEPTGFPGYDEAFLRIDNEKYSYMVMLDSNNRMIINETLIPEKDFKLFIEPFIEYSQKDLSVYNDPNRPNPPHPILLPDLKKDTLTADGYRAYPKIAKKINMQFHPCVFHKIMNQRHPSWRKEKVILNKIKRNETKIKNNDKTIEKYNKKYAGKKGRIGKNDTKRRRQKDTAEQKEKENRKLRKENRTLRKIYDTYEDCNNRISEMYDVNAIKDAKRRFMFLYNQKEHLPEEIAKFLKNQIKDLDETLAHIENENIPKTNNLLELFFRIIFPKKYRRVFKTIEGVRTFLRYRKIRWYENVVFKEKIEIEKDDVWTVLRNNYYQNKSSEIA